jgi:hypothetical protein
MKAPCLSDLFVKTSTSRQHKNTRLTSTWTSVMSYDYEYANVS